MSRTKGFPFFACLVSFSFLGLVGYPRLGCLKEGHVVSFLLGSEKVEPWWQPGGTVPFRKREAREKEEFRVGSWNKKNFATSRFCPFRLARS